MRVTSLLGARMSRPAISVRKAWGSAAPVSRGGNGGRGIIGRVRSSLVVAAAAIGLLAAAPSAWAALQWNDGQVATSTFMCVGQLVQAADVVAGYQADPSSLPKAGDVFYGHVGFGAAIDTCGGGPQYAEVDLVLPPGVSMAVDASHPITCTYTDSSAPTVTVTNPTCPTNTDDHGTYGPALSPNGPASAWALPAGRWFEIQFPLRSDRQLQGEAGGYCPQTVQEVLRSLQNDCLGVAFGLSDGAGNPWLVAHEGLVIDPAAPSPQPQPQPGPQPQPQPGLQSPSPRPIPAGPHVKLALAARQSLSKIVRARAIVLTCAVDRASRCVVRATITAAQARELHLSVKHGVRRVTLGKASVRLRRAGHATVRLTLSDKTAVALRHARTLVVFLTATATDGAGRHGTATGRAKVRR